MAKGKKTPKTAKPKKRGGRKSRAESMTGAKENEVEVRTAGIGDNSELALPAPDDYAHHLKTIKGLKDKLETAKSLVSHAKTSANKTCPGLAKSIEETIAIEREGDPAKLQKRLEMLGIGLSQIGSSIQISIFDTLAGDEMEMVYKRGFADGEGGKTANNKYPEGSPQHQQYARGWRHGTAKNLGVSPEESDETFEGAEPEQIAAE